MAPNFEPDFDRDDSPDDMGNDPNDFSAFIAEDENRLGFAMAVLHRGYELIDRGEDPGLVAQAITLLFHETGEVPDSLNSFDWASDYFENIPPEDFDNQYVGSPALGLLNEEDIDQISEALDSALEQVEMEL